MYINDTLIIFTLNNISVEFATCPEAIPNFRMIERHYFKNKLIKSFDFSFGFCVSIFYFKERI